MNGTGSHKKYNFHGGISIQLQNSECFAGETLSGIVHIKVSYVLPKSKLILIFKGKEKTQWSRSINRAIQRFQTIESIANFQIPIHDWDCKIKPGEFSLPFEFTLPASISGSFSFQHTPGLGNIAYKLHVKLMNTKNKNLKGRVPIIIKRNILSYKDHVSVTKIVRLRNWCCLDRGQCKISIDFLEPSYTPNQIVNVHIEIENSQSRLSMTGLTCKLFRMVKLQAYDSNSHGEAHEFEHKEILFSQYVPVIVEAGGSGYQPVPVDVQLNLALITNLINNLYSIDSVLIGCCYSVEVKTHLSGCFVSYGDSPKATNVVNIVPSTKLAPVVPENLSDSNFMLLPLVSVEYDPKCEVVKNRLIS